MKRLVLTLLLVILGSSVLYADGCTEEQIARMIKQNLSQDTIDSACKNNTERSDTKTSDTVGTASTANRVYIGVGITNGSGTLTREFDDWWFGSFNYTYDYDSSSTPFKIGFILDSGYRFEVSYESMEHEFTGGAIHTVSGWNMDWNFVYPSDAFTPYWTIGFGVYENEDVVVDGRNLEGVALNYGIGGLFNIDDNLEFEASLKGKIIAWQDIDYGTGIVSSDSSGVALYLGVNFKF